MTTITLDADKKIVVCRGAHHKDYASLAMCDGCGVRVAKTESGKIIDVRWRTNTGSFFYQCWSAPFHVCDPDRVSVHAAEMAQRVAAGEIVKGMTVVVVKGRKVPHGVTGCVRWLGVDSYGKARVGFMTAEGDMVFTAASNVEVAK